MYLPRAGKGIKSKRKKKKGSLMNRKEFIKGTLMAAVAAAAPARGFSEAISKVGANRPKVYFTKDISPRGLLAAYKALGFDARGKVAVKFHSGEPGGHNFLTPDFIKPVVDCVRGTLVECNTAYPGRRNTTEKHAKAIEEHGFPKIAPVDIMDADGDMELPVPNGLQIKKNFVGKHFAGYDSVVVLSHFKGHQMGGFGGALKNISIGIASSHGKAYIHGAGDPNHMWDCEQNKFLESMADACKSVVDFKKGALAYVSAMKNLSIDCDCNNHPAAPEMADIGILASLDPVALDQACVDLVYASKDPGKASLIRRMESKNAVHILEAAERLGIGSRKYSLVGLDGSKLNAGDVA